MRKVKTGNNTSSSGQEYLNELIGLKFESYNVCHYCVNLIILLFCMDV